MIQFISSENVTTFTPVVILIIEVDNIDAVLINDKETKYDNALIRK